MDRADPRLKRAMRFARRAKKCRTDADRMSTWRQMRDALLSCLPPKRDGSHPLDADNLKLEG